MKARFGLAILVFGLALLSSSGVVKAQPAPPSSLYSGTVRVYKAINKGDAVDASPGATVAAIVGGTVRGSDMVITPGRYGNPPTSYLKVEGPISEGDDVYFYLNGTQANEADTFAAGTTKNYPLTVRDIFNPVITIHSPQPFSVQDSRVTIYVEYYDTLAGVKTDVDPELYLDLASIINLGGVQYSQTQVSGGYILYSIYYIAEVGPGKHTIKMVIRDRVNNRTAQDWSFTVPAPTPAPVTTPTPTATPVPTATAIPTATPTPRPTPTPTPTPAPTATATPTATPTPRPTATPTPTATSTPRPTATSAPVVTPTAMPMPLLAPTPTATSTPTAVPQVVATPQPTATPPPATLEIPRGQSGVALAAQATPLPTATPARVTTPTPGPVAAPGGVPPGTTVRPVPRQFVPPVVPTAVVMVVVGFASYIAFRLGRFSPGNISFLAAMAGVALLGLFLLWSNSAAVVERQRLNDQLRGARVRIDRVEADTNLEVLRQTLQGANSLFPSMAEAEEGANRLYAYAEQGGLKVTQFEFRPVPADPKTKNGPAIAGIFESEGKQGSISAFLEGLGEVAPTVAVQEVKVTVVEAGKVQARLRVAIYYREK